MTDEQFNEGMEALTRRHEALTINLELMGRDIETLRDLARQDRREHPRPSPHRRATRPPAFRSGRAEFLKSSGRPLRRPR